MDQTSVSGSSKDVSTSWISTSRFMFYVSIGITLAFFLGMILGLYAHRYKGKPDVPVPSNTLYNPVYK